MYVYLLMLLFVLPVFFWAFSKTFSERKVFRLFSVNPFLYDLISSDLGGSKTDNRNFMVNRFCIGMPDAEFKAKRSLVTAGCKKHIVCEFKGRLFKGVVRYNEYYQIMLYLGVAKDKYETNSLYGVLSFKDRAIRIPFDKHVYAHLIGLVPEYHEKNSTWDANNALPLHKRKGVHLKSTGFRFVDK